MTQILFVLLVASMAVSAERIVSAQPCPDSKTCRQLALEAAERRDYDAFHDLAWRALNTGPKNDPALMTMLARAQSLSGRPHDALVMLQRLADMGVVTDAATSEDFANVRALPGWADLESKLPGKAAAPAKDLSSPAIKEAPPIKEAPAVKEAPPIKEPETLKEAPPPAKTEAPVTTRKTARGSKSAAKEKAAPEPPAPLTFEAAGLSAVGLGYDAVSGRFIVGDGRERRLLVVGERSARLASLAGLDAGFNEITAFEIDTHEGDLWVVSTAHQSRSATVHKLQLISGRVLSSIPLLEEQGPARFTDVAVTPQSVLVLDSEGRRVFRLAKKGKALDLAVRLATPDLSALAPASDALAYVAFDRGVLRVDLSTRGMKVVEPGERVDLGGLGWMRWFRGSLIAIQRTPEGASRLLRIRLDETGRMAKTADVLDDNVLLAGPTCATLSANVLYYLGRASGEGDVIVRKITLK